jgi:radical SAM protein with 4Fe4S-binding SPASM domain
MIKKEMTTKDVLRLIDEASKMGCQRFTFSGGEVFLRKDIFEIIEYCKDKRLEFLSNGKVLDRSFIEKLSKYPQIKEIKITLDGFEEHNKIRLGSDYKKIEKSIRLLKKKNFSVVINTEVTANNIHELIMLYEKLKSLKIDRWRVDLPFILGRYEKTYTTYRLPNFNKLIKVFKTILIDYLKNKPSFEIELFNVYKSEIKPINFVSFNKDAHPCEYRTGSHALWPNGDMKFCPSLNLVMANFVKAQNLKSAIKKKYEHPFYKIKISDIKECMNCRYLKLCGGGCRADAYYYFNYLTKPDPKSCNLMPLFEKEILPILPNDLQIFFSKLINKNNAVPKKYNLIRLIKNKTTK